MIYLFYTLCLDDRLVSNIDNCTIVYSKYIVYDFNIKFCTEYFTYILCSRSVACQGICFLRNLFFFFDPCLILSHETQFLSISNLIAYMFAFRHSSQRASGFVLNLSWP